MTQNVPTFDELLGSATRSAVHLEMRDSYGVGDELDEFEEWKRTGRYREGAEAEAYWRPWVDLIAGTVGRGVVVRRARIVSEPVTDYVKFEHGSTHWAMAAGELVRWLPRRQAASLALPGEDFWLIDDRLARFNHFDGNGNPTEPEMSEAPEVAKLCSTAFEAVWERGIDHSDYKLI